MKGRASKNKGKRGEREVADMITEITDIKHRRTPNSGAMRQDWPFDICKRSGKPCATDGMGNEVKNRKRWSIRKWIREMEDALEDTGMSRTSPFYIALKTDGRKDFEQDYYFVINKSAFEEYMEIKQREINEYE